MNKAKFGFPEDVVCGMPILTSVGPMEICIENFRGILEYTEHLIRVQTKMNIIRIVGKDLQIPCYTCDEIKIVGLIMSVEYL